MLARSALVNGETHWDSEMMTRLAQAKQEAPVAKLQENLLAETMQLLWEVVRLRAANRPLPEDLDLRRTEQRSVWVRLHAARVRLENLRFRRAAHFPVLPARAPRRSQDPGPYASFRETLVARKCNRAVRCGARPICVRYRPRRNRRGFAGCDNRCSRSQNKRARRARPFPIVAGDKRHSHPPPFAD
jgi:hypothetical protein